MTISFNLSQAWGYSLNQNTQTNTHETLPDQTHGGSSTSPEESSINYDSIMKIAHVVANVLGFLPVISFVTGNLRMIFHAGHAIWLLKDSQTDEISSSDLLQVGRGALEAYIPFGKLVNLGLDGYQTARNYKIDVLETVKQSWSEKTFKLVHDGEAPQVVDNQ